MYRTGAQLLYLKAYLIMFPLSDELLSFGKTSQQTNPIKQPVDVYTSRQIINKQETRNTLSKKRNFFPMRSFINFILIILSSAEVLILTTSPVYLRSSLTRSFLTVYADHKIYPSLFDGTTFQSQIFTVRELQSHLSYIFTSISNSQLQSMIKADYKNSIITLEAQYKIALQASNPKTKYIIDPTKGITDPFNLTNASSLKKFLLKIEHFSIVIKNLQIKSRGHTVMYIHQINYIYQQESVKVQFRFLIDDALIFNEANQMRIDKTYYIIYLQIFFSIIIMVSIASLYLHAQYMRFVYLEFLILLNDQTQQKTVYQKHLAAIDISGLSLEDCEEIDKNIAQTIQLKNIKITGLKFQDYLSIFELDIIFSTLASAFHVMANLFLIFGQVHERLAGLGCLFSWLTIFKIFKKNKRLMLMHDVIKISILKIIEFLLSFSILMMSYIFLGMCFFPKVSFFSSVSNTVTTLLSLIAGDSVTLVIKAIIQKSSPFLAITYVFSFVILFVYAIHNILTSIIKEFYMKKKTKLLQEQKRQNRQLKYVYIQQLEMNIYKERYDPCLLKMTPRLEQDLFKARRQKQCNHYVKRIQNIVRTFEYIFFKQKWIIYDLKLHHFQIYQTELLRRYYLLKKMLQNMQPESLKQNSINRQLKSESFLNSNL